MYDHIQVSFKTYYHTESRGHVVAVVGSSICLGSWNPAKSLILTEDTETGTWKATTRLQVGGSFEWKFAVLDRRHERIIQWEDVKNRVLSVGRLPLEVEASWNGTEQIKTLQSSATDTKLKTQSTGDVKSPQSMTSNEDDLKAKAVNVTFKIRFVPEAYNEIVAVAGSNENLGSWNPERAVVCEHFGAENCWTGSVQLPANATFEWKMVCLDKHSRHIIRWEVGRSRRLYVGHFQLDVVAPWNVKEVIRYARTPSVILTPLERKSSDVDCSQGVSANNNAQVVTERDTFLKVNFVVDYYTGNNDTILCVAGSCESLGKWKPEHSLLLRQEDGTKWHGTIFVPQHSTFEWKLLMLHNGVEVWESHFNRFLQLKNSSVEVFVAWNGSEHVELMPLSSNDFVAVTFKTRYQLKDDEIIVVAGSSGNLGAWNLKEALVLNNRHHENCWNSKQVFVVDEVVEYKLVVLDKYYLEARRWEEYPNRMLHIGRSSLEVVVLWGTREVIREVYPRQGESGAKTTMRSICLQECFSFCCTGEMDSEKDDHAAFEQDESGNNRKDISTKSTINALFETNYALSNENHVIAIAGSCDSLGKWDIGRAGQFEKGLEHGSWHLIGTLPLNASIEWKLLVMDKATHQVLRWEERENRVMKIKRSSIEIIACWNSMASVKPSEGCFIPLRYYGEDSHESDDFDDGLVAATIKTQYNCNDRICVLAVIGSTRELGHWKPECAALMNSWDNGNTWATTVRVSLNTDIHWKMILVEKWTSRVLRWEETEDRVLRIGQNDLSIVVTWNKQETTSNTKIGDVCNRETTDTGLRSVIKASSAQLKPKKSVHFANDPVAECRVFVKNKSVTHCWSENCHHDKQMANHRRCDENNNSLELWSRSYVLLLLLCISAVSIL